MRGVAALARRSVRSDTGRFLVEGPQAVRELIRYAAPSVVDVYVTPDGRARHAEIYSAAYAAGCFVHDVTDEVLAAMADADTPQGMVAVAQQPVVGLADVLDGARLLVLLHEVRDPGNLGTVIRGADATGADAVLVTANSVDAFSPKVIRSGAGSHFHVPVVAGSTSRRRWPRWGSAAYGPWRRRATHRWRYPTRT